MFLLSFANFTDSSASEMVKDTEIYLISQLDYTFVQTFLVIYPTFCLRTSRHEVAERRRQRLMAVPLFLVSRSR